MNRWTAAFIDDLITDTSERSQGYGSALIDWSIDYAQSQECVSLQLDSGVQRAAISQLLTINQLLSTTDYPTISFFVNIIIC